MTGPGTLTLSGLNSHYFVVSTIGLNIWFASSPPKDFKEGVTAMLIALCWCYKKTIFSLKFTTHNNADRTRVALSHRNRRSGRKHVREIFVQMISLC